MPSTNDAPHVDATIAPLAALYEEHQLSATPMQRLANRVTASLGRPPVLAAILALVILWIAGNYVASLFGSSALEEAPFPDLGFVATIAALLVALLILTTQRHEDELAEKRPG